MPSVLDIPLGRFDLREVWFDAIPYLKEMLPRIMLFMFCLMHAAGNAQEGCPEPSEFCGLGTTWDVETQTCIVSIPSDSNFDGCVQLNDLLDLLGSYDLGCAEWQCGDPMAYSGHDYSTISLAGGCWFAENLRTLVYSNGEDIPSNLTDSQWNYADAGAATVYGEDDGCNNYSPDIDSCDPEVALEEYGRLYNWYAVNDDRGLCPVGWHVPSEGEWFNLVSGFGGGSVAGEMLKSSYGWSYEGQGTNESGFNGMPGGKRQDGSGYFSSAGDRGTWWTSTPYSSLARFSELKFNSNSVTNSYADRETGYSVRCVQDAE